MKVVRLLIPDGSRDIKMQGTIAWAIAVPFGGSIQYRAGVEFVNPDKERLSDFCERHGTVPDPTTHERRRGDSSIRASRSQGRRRSRSPIEIGITPAAAPESNRAGGPAV
jgi:hypothetical protein